MKIMVVDDEKEIVDFLTQWLTRKRHTVYGTTESWIVPALAASTRYDIIFLDLIMPRVNGLSLVEQIRKVAPATTLVIISGIDDIRVAVAAAKQGVQDYLTKPIQMDTLQKILDRAEREPVAVA